jgi:hypothetical protein
MSERQIFGSSLRRPWALVRFGSNSPVGRRPATTIAYLTDDEGSHYLGGLVEFYRRRDEPTFRFHFRYQNPKRIPKGDVLHIFAIENKSCHYGPSKAEIRRAREALPITMSQENAA